MLIREFGCFLLLPMVQSSITYVLDLFFPFCFMVFMFYSIWLNPHLNYFFFLFFFFQYDEILGKGAFKTVYASTVYQSLSFFCLFFSSLFISLSWVLGYNEILGQIIWLDGLFLLSSDTKHSMKLVESKLLGVKWTLKMFCSHQNNFKDCILKSICWSHWNMKISSSSIAIGLMISIRLSTWLQNCSLLGVWGSKFQKSLLVAFHYLFIVICLLHSLSYLFIYSILCNSSDIERSIGKLTWRPSRTGQGRYCEV